MDFSHIKIWLAVQLIIDFLFLLGIFWFLARIKKDLEFKIFKSSSSKICKSISPFLKDASKTAQEFDSQIKEKRELINKLNESLDSKISSINFILNRAENIMNSSFNMQAEKTEDKKEGRDEKIIELYEKGLSDDEIANSLGLSVGEVSMIIKLRKKFDSLAHHRD